MTAEANVLRTDRSAPQVIAAEQAERRLFEHYGLIYSERIVRMDDPPIRLRVLEVGSGPPVLMVPGGSGEAFTYAPLVAKLAGRRLIIVNRPGGGLSDGVDYGRIDMRRLAVTTLTAILDAFALERVPVVANSMGGLWTLWAAMEHPERISAMVQLGCPALILGTSAPPPMRLLSLPVVNRLLLTVTLPASVEQARKSLGMIGCSEETRRTLPDAFPEAMVHMFNLPVRRAAWLSLMRTVLRPLGANRRYQLEPNDLSGIEHPTQFIWGDNDVFGGVDIGRQAESVMPTATLRVIAGSHIPWVDNPDECASLTNAVLQRPALTVPTQPHAQAAG
ncbi:alpha/beta hydrolase [soil metagenome]